MLPNFPLNPLFNPFLRPMNFNQYNPYLPNPNFNPYLINPNLNNLSTPTNNQQQQPQNQQQQPQNNSNNNSNFSEFKNILSQALTEIKKENENKTINSNDSEISSVHSSENNLNEFEKEYSLEEENLKNIWSGFLTKNKKERIGVDIYQIRGNIADNLGEEYNLNVSHRTTFEEVMKRPLLGIVAISPNNETQCEMFDEYIKYFEEKERAGVITIRNGFTLYVIAPCEFSRKFYQNPKKHLLGLMIKSTVEPKLYVDMNNLNLPPPVISMTEKRLLMEKRKKKNK